MDTEHDFITPEFLHLMFFRQKNLVIFPYVDVKHLRSLDIFAVGFETVDIDSTVIHNLSEIIEYESNNSYSQRPTLYFILTPSEKTLETLLTSYNGRCVVNMKENVESLANGDKFVFYNKKSNSFLNYSFEKRDLAFERHLIQSSETKQVLLDQVLKIKSASSKIFTEINERNSSDRLPDLLSEFDQNYWGAVLEFTRLYYQIEIPKFETPEIIPKKENIVLENDFSREYDVILKSNKTIGKSFVTLLHDYRFKKVNPANLEVDQLFYPEKLYTYLRNHHWKRGIPKDFVLDWVTMVNKDENLKEDTLWEFQIVLNKLDLPLSLPELTSSVQTQPRKKPSREKNRPEIVPEKKEVVKDYRVFSSSIPSVENFEEFKQWVLEKLDELESLSNKQV